MAARLHHQPLYGKGAHADQLGHERAAEIEPKWQRREARVQWLNIRNPCANHWPYRLGIERGTNNITLWINNLFRETAKKGPYAPLGTTRIDDDNEEKVA